MPCINIRGCAVGAGRPKVIVPIVERSESAVLAAAAALVVRRLDVVEWRADWFDGCTDAAALTHCLHSLHARLGELPLLVTCRTKAEGGEQALILTEYEAFCRTVCASGCADALDVELLPAGARLSVLIELAHTYNVKVICSSHDFEKTPPQAEMVRRMVQMQQAGADIAKLAVMPRSRADVLALLAATAEMTEQHPATPVVTMSMGALGAVSRLAGETFGSAMTFASAGKASAPGQVELDVLNAALDALHG